LLVWRLFYYQIFFLSLPFSFLHRTFEILIRPLGVSIQLLPSHPFVFLLSSSFAYFFFLLLFFFTYLCFAMTSKF
jgi:hypothetical protein